MPSPESRLVRYVWPVQLLLLVVAGVVALLFHLREPARSPAERDYLDAARYIQENARPGDVVLLFPWWSERARLYVPEEIPVVGHLNSDRDDLMRYPRIWVLAQPELLAVLAARVRVEHHRDLFRLGLGRHRVRVAARVELVEIEGVGRLGAPEPERVHAIVAIARDRHVEGNGEHVVSIDPAAARNACAIAILLDAAAEVHALGKLVTADLPGKSIVLEPVVGLLDLTPVDDALPEHAVAITDAVADNGQPQGRRAVEKAGREAAQAPVAEAGVVLQFENVGIGESETGAGLGAGVVDAEVHRGVTQQPPHEVLEREITGLPAVAGFALPQRDVEALDEPVAQHVRERAVDERRLARERAPPERVQEIVRKAPHDGVCIHRQRRHRQESAARRAHLLPASCRKGRSFIFR